MDQSKGNFIRIDGDTAGHDGSIMGLGYSWFMIHESGSMFRAFCSELHDFLLGSHGSQYFQNYKRVGT